MNENVHLSYEAMVPDTLDLADRAGFAINGLTRTSDPAHNYETYQCANFNVHPPYMNLMYGGPCLQKPVEALPMMRVMSGSRQNIEVDGKIVEACTRDIEEDGLWWLNLEGRPWRNPFGQDFAYIPPHGRLMVALMTWYAYNQNPKWLELVRKMADGLANIAIYKDDYAYYGGGNMYFRSGWQSMEEPGGFSFDGLAVRGLAQWYAISGDTKALDLARRLVRWMTKPRMWGSSEEPKMVVGTEHGHWEGHFHSRTMNLMGILEYAIVADDVPLKRFVAFSFVSPPSCNH